MSNSATAPDLFVGENNHERLREQDGVREVSSLPEEPLLSQEVRVVKDRHRDHTESDVMRAWVGPRPKSVVYDPELDVTRERVGAVAGTRGEVLADPTAYIGQEGHPPAEATVMKFTVETPEYYQTYSYGPGPGGDWEFAQGAHMILFPAPWLVMDRIPKDGSSVTTNFDKRFHGEMKSEQTRGVEWTEIDGKSDTPRSE